MTKEHAYTVHPALTKPEFTRLGYHIAVLGHKSIREFVTQAIKEKMANDLARLPSEKSLVISTLIDSLCEGDTNGLV